MDEGRCRSCHALVWWVTMHPSGKKNPLDEHPDPGRGNILVVDDRLEAARYETRVGRAVTLKRDDAAAKRAVGRDLYLSHFATCKSAERHRA